MATLVFFFFFQAEDGIRDKLVTGVQTCALPISGARRRRRRRRDDLRHLRRLPGRDPPAGDPGTEGRERAHGLRELRPLPLLAGIGLIAPPARRASPPHVILYTDGACTEIGRAAWRGKGENS